MKREAKTKGKNTKVSHGYTFVITSDWKPSKATSNSIFMDAIVNTALGLVSMESFPVSMIDLNKLCGYSTGASAASSIRSWIRKRVGKNKIGEYGCHVVKDHAGKTIAVRVRKK